MAPTGRVTSASVCIFLHDIGSRIIIALVVGVRVGGTGPAISIAWGGGLIGCRSYIHHASAGGGILPCRFTVFIDAGVTFSVCFVLYQKRHSDFGIQS